MKTLTILVRRAAARWAQKHRAACQAQPEQHIPTGEAVQKTADKPTSEERKAEKAAETSEQVHAANRQAVSGIVDMERRLKAFLADRYRFRYNLLTGMTEFLERNALPESGKSLFRDKETIPENKERNPKERETNSGVARMFAFRPLTARAFNTICLAAHEAGIGCWDRDLLRHVESGNVAEFHPFRAYFAVLPPWDGQDRIMDLARRVSDSPLWIEGFHRWLLAAAAQWTGYAGPLHANAVAPLLVSTAQGLGKSAFCRALLPPELRDYFTDHVDLTASANYRKAYSRHAEALPRIASFIGTSNSHELLTDPTGSRRFLCVEVTHPIDCSGIAYEQIYAQLKAELEAGDRYWFTGPVLPDRPCGGRIPPLFPCSTSGRGGPSACADRSDGGDPSPPASCAARREHTDVCPCGHGGRCGKAPYAGRQPVQGDGCRNRKPTGQAYILKATSIQGPVLPTTGHDLYTNKNLQ